jgi:hypothetical protein
VRSEPGAMLVALVPTSRNGDNNNFSVGIQECRAMIEPPEKGPRWARDAVNAANSRNKKMGYSEEFKLEDLIFLWNECKGKCFISGLEFSFLRVGSGQAQRPFAPSLDRIDSAKPYTRGNVRIVLQVANFAMNAWGLSPLHQLAAGILRVNGPYPERRPSSIGPTDATIGLEPLIVEGEVVDTDQGMLIFPQRSDLIWPTLAFIQTGEKNSHEIENYLSDLFLLAPESLEAKYDNGMPVWRNLVSWVLVELGHHKYDAIERDKTLLRPGGGTMGLYRVTERGTRLMQNDLSS